MPNIMLTAQFQNAEFASSEREQGLEKLRSLGTLIPEPAVLTAEHAPDLIASIASSSVYTDEFYEAAEDLRIVARWGVGFDKVNIPGATRHGVIITVTPVHMDAVAEYAIAQWMATLKRVYTLNHLSHRGDFSIIRTYEAQYTTLGLYGCGRIGQEVAQRAVPLLGEGGRLLIYDTRPDIADIAAQYGAEVADSPETLFRECDTVSLHVSGDDTIVHYDLLSLMQPHASLINPSEAISSTTRTSTAPLRRKNSITTWSMIQSTTPAPSTRTTRASSAPTTTPALRSNPPCASTPKASNKSQPPSPAASPNTSST